MTRKIKFILAVAIAVLSLDSCNKNNQDPVTYYQASVTLKQKDGILYMRQDDSTALISSNLSKYPYAGSAEHRAMILFSTTFQKSKTSVSGFKNTYDIELKALDSTMTKKPVISKGTPALDEKAYGKDPVGLYFSPTFPPTMVEDGYLSITFAFRYGGNVIHSIDLVTGVDAEDPYTVELRHNANGDFEDYESSGNMIAFPLKSLPDTKGKTVKLTLKWTSLATGQKESAQFDYCTRNDWPEEE